MFAKNKLSRLGPAATVAPLTARKGRAAGKEHPAGDGGARQDLARLTPTCGQFKVPTLREIDDLVAFLCTLTDGYDPKNPSAYTVPDQCLPTAVPAAASTEGSVQ
jgi:hypothetical protein